MSCICLNKTMTDEPMYMRKIGILEDKSCVCGIFLQSDLGYLADELPRVCTQLASSPNGWLPGCKLIRCCSLVFSSQP